MRNMARAALTLWEVTGDRRYLDRARAWVHTLNDHFWDAQNGGYFYTADDSDPLIVRSRSGLRPGNAVREWHDGIRCWRACHLATSDNAYRDRCNALIEAFSGEPQRAFMAMPSYLNGLEVGDDGLADRHRRSGHQSEDARAGFRRHGSQSAQSQPS